MAAPNSNHQGKVGGEVCSAIERKWIETGLIEEAWEAGCRAWKYARVKDPRHKGTPYKGGSRRSRFDDQGLSKVRPRKPVASKQGAPPPPASSCSSDDNDSSSSDDNDDGQGVKGREPRFARPAHSSIMFNMFKLVCLGAFAETIPGDTQSFIWTDIYAACNRKEPRFRPRIENRDPYGRKALNMSIEARFPYMISNGRSRIHIMPNMGPTAHYLNNLVGVFPPIMLPLVLLMDNYALGEERAELILRFDHLHLIGYQTPYRQKSRFKIQPDKRSEDELMEQWTTGIATEEGCSTKVWRVLDQSDPYEIIPRIGPDRVPWAFEGGPIPDLMTTQIFYAIFAQFLSALEDECDKYYVTTCTVETLMIAYFWQMVHRNDANEEFRDLFGLQISIYDRSPLMVSVGKKAHGLQMFSGGPISGEFESLADFDFDQGNLDFSPWASNLARYTWDAEITTIQRHFRKNLRAATPWWPNPLPPVPPLPSLNKKSGIATPDPKGALDDTDDEEGLFIRSAADDELRRVPAGLDDELGMSVAEILRNETFPQYSEMVASLNGEFSLTMREVHGSLWDIADETEDGENVENGTVPPGSDPAIPAPKRPTPHEDNLVPQTDSSVHRQVFNFRNAGSTCYASVILQLFHHIEPLRALLLQEFPCSEETGRHPSDIDLISNLPRKQYLRLAETKMLLYDTFTHGCQILDGLLSKSYVKRHEILSFVEDCCNPLDTEYKNREADSEELFAHILSWLNIAADTSTPLTSGTRPIILLANERHSRAVDLSQPRGLRDDEETQMEAYKSEGYRSSITDTTTIQIVRESICNLTECNGISRTFEQTSVLTLQLAVQPLPGKNVSLNALIDVMMKDCPSEGSECPIDKSHSNLNKKFRRRFGILPEIFKIHIARFGNGGPRGTQTLMDEVDMPTALDLSRWVDGGPGMFSEELWIGREKTNQNSRYDLVGMVVYANHHYLAYVKVAEIWYLFDDPQDVPKKEEPSARKRPASLAPADQEIPAKGTAVHGAAGGEDRPILSPKPDYADDDPLLREASVNIGDSASIVGSRDKTREQLRGNVSPDRESVSSASDMMSYIRDPRKCASLLIGSTRQPNSSVQFDDEVRQQEEIDAELDRLMVVHRSSIRSVLSRQRALDSAIMKRLQDENE
ncbi:uncharacterized protein RAG0_07232 [Rhynchosporium agropyri]|uniref:USP domain-containing protein n=1 Tax=Rhynchosporium agropyri TaxID=914238 RepID=A0A1E1KKN5_9HELO|nr:uncharacterized protein RAG0_07232 [Rhynchosporium agropyri]